MKSRALPLLPTMQTTTSGRALGRGFAALRERVVAAGGWEQQQQNGYPDLPDFLRRGKSMTTRTPLDPDRLRKLCGMFGSHHVGERANAARTADALVRQHGLTWG